MRLLKLLCWLVFTTCCAVLLATSGTFLYLMPTLPSTQHLRNTRLQIPLRVYSEDERLIAEFGEMRRSPITFAEIPRDFVDALLAAEDDGFATHHGVDISSLLRALVELAQTGQFRSGGSTITMQVAKNFFLTPERSLKRKLTEILLALQIERELSKNEIFELYVNKIFLGQRTYGIEAAAQVYYGKSIRDLSLAQMATIAGLPKGPSKCNPITAPKCSIERRNWILGRMYRLGKIDEKRWKKAMAERDNARLHIAEPEVDAPWIAEMVRAQMVSRYGDDAYTEGFRVITTVSGDLQQAARQAIQQGLAEYDQRHGWRGAEQRLAGKSRAEWQALLATQQAFSTLEPAVVAEIASDGIGVLLRTGKIEFVPWSSMQWARPFLSNNSLGASPKRPSDVVQVGDLIRVQRQDNGRLYFSQLPKAQGALIALAPKDGAIRALVGGFSFTQSSFNRAIQARRQPGSSLKPFIYSAALDKGFTAASLLNDSPIVFAGNEQSRNGWRPKNYGDTFLGPISLRESLYRSRNLASIRLLQDIGVRYALNYLNDFGFESQYLPADLSLALGNASLTPMEVVRGWATFANGGYRIEPYLIKHIEDHNGNRLFTARPKSVPTDSEALNNETEPAERIIDGRTAYIMTDMLQDVIKRGGGRRALELKRGDLAGKTGTSNESKDAWFSGYNADHVATVWTGFDQPQTLGRREIGGTVALPIWMRFMSVALKDSPEHMLGRPTGLISLRVDPQSGGPAHPSTPGAYSEWFKSEAPPEASDNNIAESDDNNNETLLPEGYLMPPMDLF